MSLQNLQCAESQIQICAHSDQVLLVRQWVCSWCPKFSRAAGKCTGLDTYGSGFIITYTLLSHLDWYVKLLDLNLTETLWDLLEHRLKRRIQPSRNWRSKPQRVAETYIEIRDCISVLALLQPKTCVTDADWPVQVLFHWFLLTHRKEYPVSAHPCHLHIKHVIPRLTVMIHPMTHRASDLTLLFSLSLFSPKPRAFQRSRSETYSPFYVMYKILTKITHRRRAAENFWRCSWERRGINGKFQLQNRRSRGLLLRAIRKQSPTGICTSFHPCFTKY